MKKALLFLLVCVLLLGCAASAEEPEWVYNDRRNEVSRYNGAGGEVTVPDTVDGYPALALGNGVFTNNDAITGLTLPDGLRSIGNSCINNCANLRRVTLDEGLQAIEYNNFMALPQLTELTIPASVVMIDYSINWCENLKTITFLGECPVFVHSDFCLNVLAEDVTVYVPDDQLDAYRAAIWSLDTAQIQPSGQNAVVYGHASAESDFLFDAATGTITGYTGNSLRVEIPAKIGGVPVTKIGMYAFENSPAVIVRIPEGVTEIESLAFEGAKRLHVVDLPNSLRVIGSAAFDGIAGEEISWGRGIVTIDDGAFRNAEIGSVLILPDSLETIGEEAFKGASLSDVYIGGNIRSIGAGAFRQTNLHYLCIDAYHMIEVGEEAFARTYLKDVDLPWDSDLENQRAWQALIDSQVEGCKVWINNPEDCDTPEYGTDTYAENPDGTLYLQSYTGDQEALVLWHNWDDVPVTGLGEGVFRNNQTLKKYRVTHSDKFTAIGAEAFAGSAVETVDLYYTTETIGEGAFRDCLGLTSIVLPASLKQVGESAFAGCVNLREVTILCDPAILPENCFADTAYAKAAAAPPIDMEQFLGDWRLCGLSEGGEEIDLASYPIRIRLTVRDDGTANLTGDGEDHPMRWYQRDGVLWMGDGEEDDPVELDGEGRLIIAEEDMVMVFAREDAAEIMQPEAIELPAEYAGRWIAQVMSENGTELDVAAFGIEMTLTLNADGTAVLDTDGDAEQMLCYWQDGVLCIGDGVVNIPVLLEPDGRLRVEEGDMRLIFAREGEAPAVPVASAAAVPEVFAGTWYGILVDAGIGPMDAHGMDIVLTLNADGSGYLNYGDTYDTFRMEDGQAFFGDMPITLREDGRLMYGSPLQGAIYFSRDPQDVMQPEARATKVPVSIATPAPAAPAATGDYRLETKYLAVTYTAAGYTLDASILGAEYSLVLHPNGQCDMTTAGMPMPTMTWTQNGDGSLTLDYMGALSYTAVLNGENLEVDMGGMVLTYAPQD